MAAMHWDVFCRVIDNHGDLGVCWRLCRDLAARGQVARLFVDDASALAWMAPDAASRRGVSVLPWSAAERDPPPPGDVVVEAFGCDPPASFVAQMAEAGRAGRPPVWINLEYLSAEDWVERAHGLPSPQSGGPGQGLTKWFWFPGFTARTGGLLREPGLPSAQDDFAADDAAAFLRALGVPDDGAKPVSVFTYPHAPLTALAATLATAPGASTWRLLLTPGTRDPLSDGDFGPGLCSHRLPWLTQPDYDRLLRASALNIVRGEDSFVRAQWAGRPFVWHIYPQDDGAHGPKLQAFLDRFGADAVPRLGASWTTFNGLLPLAPDGRLPWPDEGPWQAACTAWRARQEQFEDLVTQLLGFVASRRSPQQAG